MNAFPLKFPGRGWVSVDGQFPQIFEWETRWATRKFSLQRIPARWNWVEKLVFCAVFIYLFIICLFIVCFYVCFFNYFKGVVCWFMHQFCGLVPWGLWWAISVFWWVSSGLICSSLNLMLDEMKNLPSFLICCCYCL